MKIKIIFHVLLISTFLFGQDQNRILKLDLNHAVEYALVNNVEVKKAIIDTKSAKQKTIETLARGLPQINGQAVYNNFLEQPVAVIPANVFNPMAPANQFNEVVFGTQQDISFGATWSQLIFSGSYLVAVKSSVVYKETFDLSKLKTDAQIKEKVIALYGTVLVADENLRIVESNLKLAEKNLYEATEIFKQGLVEEQTVEQLQLSVNQLKSAENTAKRSKAIAIRSLRFLLGIKEGGQLKLITTFNEMIDPSFLYAKDNTIDENEITENVNYKLSENNLRIKKLQVDYEKSFALPQLSGFLNYRQQKFSNDFPFFSDDTDWNPVFLLGFQLDVPIFSSFQRKSRTEQARLAFDKAEIDHENVSEQLRIDIAQKKSDYDSSIDNLKLAKEALQIAESIYRKESIKYKEGLTGSTDLSTAERQKYTSDGNYINAAFDVIDKKNKLFQALGKY